MDHMTLAIRVQDLQRYTMNQLLLFSKNLRATASKNVAVSVKVKIDVSKIKILPEFELQNQQV